MICACFHTLLVKLLFFLRLVGTIYLKSQREFQVKFEALVGWNAMCALIILKSVDIIGLIFTHLEMHVLKFSRTFCFIIHTHENFALWCSHWMTMWIEKRLLTCIDSAAHSQRSPLHFPGKLIFFGDCTAIFFKAITSGVLNKKFQSSYPLSFVLLETL